MTTRHPLAAGQCPAHAPLPPPDGPLPIFGAAFAADPQATYRRLRAQAPIAPVEIDTGVYGYLAVTYQAALHLLRNNPARFRKDPANWAALRAGQVPPSSPALMMMGPRPNALWADGAPHARLRGAVTGALARVDTFALARSVAAIGDRLIDAFVRQGEADLVAQYAAQLPTLAVIDLFRSPSALGEQIVRTVTQVINAGPDAARANAELEAACLELTRLRRAEPGPDVISHLIEAGLGDDEMVQQLVLLFGAAAPPTSNHIGSALRRILTDSRFAGSVHSGVRPVAGALDEVLWYDPPISNYSPLYAQGVQQFGPDVFLQPGYPILVSFAAANNDPALNLGLSPDARAGSRGHLAFSAGPHACPAPGIARVIAETALERALDRLSGLTLAVPAAELPTLPATFLSGPASLPVRFHRDTPQHTPNGR
ncbi:cytochrome P450 [Streptomyces sp. NPDC054770]